MLKIRFLLTFICSCFINTIQAQNCYEDSILRPSPFMGNGEIFKLSDETIVKIVSLK